MKQYLWFIALIAFLNNGCDAPKGKTVAAQRLRDSLPALIVAAKQLNDCTTSRLALQETLSRAEKGLSQNDTALANVYYALALTSLDVCKEYDTAILYGQKAFDIRKSELGSDNILTARSGNLVAKAYIEKNELLKALNVYEDIQAYQNPLNAQDSADLADIHGSIARIYFYLGDAEQNKIHTEKALSLFTTAGFPENRAYYLNTLALAQRANGDGESAVQTYQKVCAAFAHADSIDPSNKQFWQSGMPSAWHNWGVAEHQNHHYEAAKQLFIKALATFERQKDSVSAAETRIEQAKLFIDLKQWANAETAAKTALTMRRKLLSPQHPDIVESWTVLGNIKAALKQTKAAKEYYDNACNAIGNYRALEIVEPLMRRAVLTVQMSQTDTSKLDTAFSYCLVADSILTEIRQIFPSDVTKAEFSKYTSDFYELAVGVATTLYKLRHTPQYLDAAARFISRNKSQNWLDKVRDQKAKRFGGINEKDLQREQNLYAELAFLEKTKAESSDIVQNSTLNTQLLNVKTHLNLLKKEFEIKYPHYATLKYANDAPLSIHDLQKRLDDSTAVIEFYLGKNTLFTLSFNQKEAHLFQLPLNADFQKNIKNLRRSLTDEAWLADSTIAAEKQFKNAAYKVFEALLKQPLDKFAQTKRLRIVPDGRLGYLPFDALLEKPTTNDWQVPSKMPYLLNHYAISEVFSLHQISFDDPSVKSPDFAGFGIEYADQPTSEIPTDEEYTFRSDKMGQLRFAVTEVKNIQNLLKTGRVWLNNEAQKAAFLQNAPQFDILHLAMHGFSDDKHPLNSGLVFSKNRADTAQNAEILRGYDIYNLSLKAKLAVLSACHTGDGEVQYGQGVMSLARAFAEAGCASEVMSLWSIPDKTTSDIMTEFYKNWQAGQPKDKALQNAKRHYLLTTSPQYAVPNYWAATVVIGDLAAIEPSFWRSFFSFY